MKDKIFFDTNILVYLSNEESLFHNLVLKKFKKIVKDYEIWISRQVLREYAVVMSRKGFYKKTLKSQEIIDDINKWEESFRIIDESQQITDNLKALILKYNLQGKRIHDANIVASMKAFSIPLLFTYNLDDFKIFSEIKLMDVQPPAETKDTRTEGTVGKNG